MTFVLTLVLAAGLSAADLERLGEFSAAWSNPSPQKTAEARDAFAGRGAEIASHFLRHARGPRNDAYAFVLRSLGEASAALTLLEALPVPPRVEDGPLDHFWGEVLTVVEATLDDPSVAADPAVAEAIIAAIERTRGRQGDELLVTSEVSLLGKCRGPAVASHLTRLSRDPDASVRAAAVTAIGLLPGEAHAASSGAPEGGAEIALGARLFDRLAHDEDPETRAQAAMAVAKLGTERAAGPLRDAALRERDPLVVDAIVFSLRQIDAPIREPEICRQVADRCHETGCAQPLFDCWRATASPDALLTVATEARPALRAVALEALVGRPANPRPLVQLPSSPLSPPFLDAPPGAYPIRPAVREDRPRAAIDEPTRQRLVTSTIALLGEPRAESANQIALDVLWTLAGDDPVQAFRWADRIPDWKQRFWASYRLGPRSQGAYDAYRRSRELSAAALLLVPLLVLLWLPATRRLAAAGLLALGVWTFGTFEASGALDLPPWPYPLAKVRFLLAVAVTASAAVVIARPRVWRIAAAPLAGAVFIVLYSVTRDAGFYPPDTLSGYLLIFEPVAGAIGAVVLALPIAFLTAPPRRRRDSES